MFEQSRRPKSAPPTSCEHVGNRPRSRLGIADATDRSLNADNGEPLTLEDTINRFHTTGRIVQRLKERRRTEAEITVCLKPSVLLEAELRTKRVGHGQLDGLLARVCRPTAAHTARASSCRRINAKDIYVPPKVAPIGTQQLQCDAERFKGNRPMSSKDRKSLVNRLSANNPKRGPAESRRTQSQDLVKQLGPLASYRWNGVKNC